MKFAEAGLLLNPPLQTKLIISIMNAKNIFLFAVVVIMAQTGCQNGNTFQTVWLSTKYGEMNMEMKLTAVPSEMGFSNASVVFIVGPSDGQPYYICKGGENMETHLAEYFRFHVYVEPEYEIKIYDFSVGELTLEAWRSQREETFITSEVAGKWVRTEEDTGNCYLLAFGLGVSMEGEYVKR